MGWVSKGTITPRFPLWGVVSAFQPPYLLSKSWVPGALTHQTTVLFFRDVVGLFFFFHYQKNVIQDPHIILGRGKLDF